MAALPGATPAINDTRPADDDPTDPEQALMLGTSTSPPSGQPGPLQAAVRDDRQAAAEKRAEKEAEKMRVDTDAVVCDSGWRFVELVSRALYLPGAKMGLAVLWVLTGFTFVLYGVVIMDEPEATDEIMDLHWIVTGVAIIDCMLMATLMLSAQDSLAVVTTDVKVSSLAALGYGEAKISTQSKTALDRWYKLFASLACASVVMGPVSVVNMNFNVGTWNFPFVREIDGWANIQLVVLSLAISLGMPVFMCLLFSVQVAACLATDEVVEVLNKLNNTDRKDVVAAEKALAEAKKGKKDNQAVDVEASPEVKAAEASLKEHKAAFAKVWQKNWNEVETSALLLASNVLPCLGEGWSVFIAVTFAFCWIAALGLLVVGLADENPMWAMLTVIATLLPAVVAWPLAAVSSQCDTLLIALNKQRVDDLQSHAAVASLETALRQLNKGKGFGFLVFGTVVDKRVLQQLFIGIFSLATTIVPVLLLMKPATAGDEECSLNTDESELLQMLLKSFNATCTYNFTVGPDGVTVW